MAILPTRPVYSPHKPQIPSWILLKQWLLLWKESAIRKAALAQRTMPGCHLVWKVTKNEYPWDLRTGSNPESEGPTSDCHSCRVRRQIWTVPLVVESRKADGRKLNSASRSRRDSGSQVHRQDGSSLGESTHHWLRIIPELDSPEPAISIAGQPLEPSICPEARSPHQITAKPQQITKYL